MANTVTSSVTQPTALAASNVIGGSLGAKGYQADARGAHPPRGWFAEFIGATPKYATNAGPLQDYRNSMARMYVPVGDKDYRAFVAAITAADPASAPLATLLAGDPTSASAGTGYIDFLLQSVSHALNEKMQVTELLSDNYVVYYFGQAAPQFSYSGTLLNTFQDDQLVNMFRIYNTMIRGSQLAKYNKVVKFRYNGMIVGGTIGAFNWNLDSGNETAIGFQLSLLVKSISVLPNPNYGLVTLKQLPATAGITSANDQTSDDGTRPVTTTLLPTAVKSTVAATNVSQAAPPEQADIPPVTPGAVSSETPVTRPWYSPVEKG